MSSSSLEAVQELGRVDPTDLINWIVGIPFEEWTQQQRIDDQLRPAMINDVQWHNFGYVSEPLIKSLLARHFPGCTPGDQMLSVVMPGHSIHRHRDPLRPGWATRVHVPLTTNAEAIMLFQRPYCLEVGKAYRVDISQEHGVHNNGKSPRIHFMFDVYGG